MEITDANVLKLVKTVQSPNLECALILFPEKDEAYVGMSEMDALKYELYWLIDWYEEDGTIRNMELTEAKRIMAETKNGKVMPLIIRTLEPKYSKKDILRSQEIVGEYKRLKRLQKKIGAY